VLMLRGEQTAGELRLRTERYCDFPSVEQVEAVLAGLQTRDEPLTIRLERRPGEKEARHRHLLGNSDAPRPAPATESAPPEDALTKLEARLAALEERVTALESN
ncbi:MAG: DUF480 domain-containing protein, partial [Acidimicrobiia bacterium]|nr:DUF480 domain-containing protein [Acidimicrobiia bacterium]